MSLALSTPSGRDSPMCDLAIVATPAEHRSASVTSQAAMEAVQFALLADCSALAILGPALTFASCTKARSALDVRTNSKAAGMAFGFSESAAHSPSLPAQGKRRTL